MKKILIMDMEIGQAFYQSEIQKLRDDGYDIKNVKCIDAANNVLRQFTPDLIIMDTVFHPGEFSLEETYDGMNTGVVFYHKYIEPKKIPTIITIKITTNKKIY